METNNFIKDDFLSDLIKKSSPDSPSAIFVERVMEDVQKATEYSSSKKTIYLYLWSALPVILIITIILLFLLTSDLPLSTYFPGKDYYTQTLEIYLHSLSNSFNLLFVSRYFSFGFTVMLATGTLIIIENIWGQKIKEFFLSRGL